MRTVTVALLLPLAGGLAAFLLLGAHPVQLDELDLGVGLASMVRKLKAGRCDFFVEELETIYSARFNDMDLLARSQGVAALIATHNFELARHMDRVLALKDGQLEPISL